MIKRKTLKLQNHQRFLDCQWSMRRSLGPRTRNAWPTRCQSFWEFLRDARWRSSCTPETRLCIGRPRLRCSLSRRSLEGYRRISLQNLRHPRTCRVSMNPTNKKLQTAILCCTLRGKLFWHLFALKRPFYHPEKFKIRKNMCIDKAVDKCTLTLLSFHPKTWHDSPGMTCLSEMILGAMRILPKVTVPTCVEKS